jgi:WXG100 family type VII secretion target
MADSKIKINQEELMKVSTSLAKRIAEMITLNTRLEALITRINESWNGEASDAYIIMMTSYLNDCKKHIDLLNSFKSYIDSVVKKFSDWDSSSSNLISKV